MKRTGGNNFLCKEYEMKAVDPAMPHVVIMLAHGSY